MKSFADNNIKKNVSDLIRISMAVSFGALQGKYKLPKFLSYNTEEYMDTNDLFDMIDDGRICEAENILLDALNETNKENIILGFEFYNTLNEKSDSFLEEHNFSREEILEGVNYLVDKTGIDRNLLFI